MLRHPEGTKEVGLPSGFPFQAMDSNRVLVVAGKSGESPRTGGSPSAALLTAANVSLTKYGLLRIMGWSSETDQHTCPHIVGQRLDMIPL